MFSLIQGFWSYFFASVKINVLIIGVDNAGKTTLLERIKSQYGTTQGLPPSKIPPTIGMNLAKIKYKGTQVVFWDLGGQTKMRKVWESYYAEANAVVFVVDSADTGRLQDAKDAFSQACANDVLAHTPVIFLANKQDLPHSRSPEVMMAEVVGAGPGALLIKGGLPPALGTSALTLDGIADAVSLIVDLAKEHASREI